LKKGEKKNENDCNRAEDLLGMMAAITAAKKGDKVTLLEKNNSLGKKLLITGKGRCNITSSLDMSEFIENIPGNGRFLFSCFQNFTNQDIINMLKKHGLEVKNERGNRIFPVTDKALDVLNCFIEELKEQNVNIRTNSEVVEITEKTGEIAGVYLASRRIYNS
jgi:hypothetical protein